MSDLSPRDIARSLAAEIERLAAELLPGGHREGPEWVVPSSASPFGCSISVRLTGDKAGAWAAGEGGDALDLAEAVLDKSTGQAITWARRWLGLDDGEAEKPRSASPQRPRPAPAAGGSDTHQSRTLDIWRGAFESIASTRAETYLHKRDLVPARLYSWWGHAQWPATLRYSERAAVDPERDCCALLVAVHGREGLVCAIHRILLDADGQVLRSRDAKKLKLSLGPIAGHAAMFDYWPDPEGRWGIAEGVETGLSAYS